MMKWLAARPYSLVLVGLLTGCQYTNGLFLSPEEKINAAFPVSDAARAGKDALEQWGAAQIAGGLKRNLTHD